MQCTCCVKLSEMYVWCICTYTNNYEITDASTQQVKCPKCISLVFKHTLDDGWSIWLHLLCVYTAFTAVLTRLTDHSSRLIHKACVLHLWNRRKGEWRKMKAFADPSHCDMLSCPTFFSPRIPLHGQGRVPPASVKGTGGHTGHQSCSRT